VQFVCPTCELVLIPGGHGSHVDWPINGCTVPAAQGAHVADPLVGALVPAGQIAHGYKFPVPFAAVPTSHGRQLIPSFVPVPGGHGKHGPLFAIHPSSQGTHLLEFDPAAVPAGHA
jgi:hypothetical protein